MWIKGYSGEKSRQINNGHWVKVFPREEPHTCVLPTIIDDIGIGSTWECGCKSRWVLTSFTGPVFEPVIEVNLGKGVIEFDAYCVMCKEKGTTTGIVKVSDSGRRMAQGKCQKCGTKVNRILGRQ